MPENYPPEIQKKIEQIKNLQMGYIIVDDSTDEVYGIKGWDTLLAWTDPIKAKNFIIDNNLDSEEDRVEGHPMPSLCSSAISQGFQKIIFDMKGMRVGEEEFVVTYVLDSHDYLHQLTDN